MDFDGMWPDKAKYLAVCDCWNPEWRHYGLEEDALCMGCGETVRVLHVVPTSQLVSDEVVEAVARSQHPNFERYGSRKRMAALWDARKPLKAAQKALEGGEGK